MHSPMWYELYTKNLVKQVRKMEWNKKVNKEKNSQVMSNKISLSSLITK